MELEQMLTIDGWALALKSEYERKHTSTYHYFVDSASACGKWKRPRYVHPLEPEPREACKPCYRYWQDGVAPKLGRPYKEIDSDGNVTASTPAAEPA